MQFHVTYERPEDDGPKSGPVKVGWLLTDRKAGIVFEPPERVRSADLNRAHAKSASRCPAVINMESRYFVIKCPFDLNLGLVRDKEGRPALKNLSSDASPIRAKKLNQHLYVTAEKEWRYANRPTIQLALPYLFICDEPCYMTQVPAFMHYRDEQMPGTMFGGRFPINVWPRPLMWAFEWHDVQKPLKIARGEPLFYCLFETEPQDRSIQMVEAQHSEELDEYLDLISGAVNYVNQTFSLFKQAEERRPEKLLKTK
ncbi:MAG: hypothetical protein AAGK00_11325 [Pseudomonadota bacterium]